MGRCGLDGRALGYGQFASCFERVMKLRFAQKVANFLAVEELFATEEALCSLQLFT
jgi:hypothetical protein